MRQVAINRGEQALANYISNHDGAASPGEGLVDLLADLIQYADHAGLDWDEALLFAYMHAGAEMDPDYDEDNPI